MFHLLKILLALYARWLDVLDKVRPQDRMEIMTSLARCILPEYRFKWPELDGWNDARFNTTLEGFGELDGFNTDRRWMIDQLLRLVHTVPGDTAECGTYKGLSSFIICQGARRSAAFERVHHVFDSFAGLSPPTTDDGGHWKAGDLSVAEQVVRDT